MTTWEEEMAELVSVEAMRPVMESLAVGGCIDEGERATDWEGLHPVMGRPAEDREGLSEHHRDAAIWLYENPHPSIPEPYRRALIELSTNPSPQVRRALADAIADKVNIFGVVKTRPAITANRRGSKDPLSTEEFIERYHSDVADMMRYEGLTRKQAEDEFPWRYAEALENIKRCPDKARNKAQARLKKTKNAAYQRVYRNI